MAVILAAVGWRVAVVQGGYKTWRSLVVRALHDTPVPSPLIVLDGQTGTAKTALLARMAARGVQVIDLEGLANHRGSLFGGMPGGQPTQRGFEGRLAMALAALDPARPVVVEAESSKVGNLALPPMLWKAMLTAPRLAVTAPVPARAAYLTRAYADLVADADRLDTVVASLRPLHPAEVIAHWRGLVRNGDVVALAADLMTRHYDQRYERSRARSADRIVATFEVDGLEDAGLDRLADRLTSAVRAL
jgi:tRNA 2-selenouridine synthase